MIHKVFDLILHLRVRFVIVLDLDLQVHKLLLEKFERIFILITGQVFHRSLERLLSRHDLSLQLPVYLLLLVRLDHETVDLALEIFLEAFQQFLLLFLGSHSLLHPGLYLELTAASAALFTSHLHVALIEVETG